MTIQPKGYEATLQRVDELKSRLRSLRSKPEEPTPSPSLSPLVGKIGSNDYVPLDPFAGQATLTQTGAPHDIKSLIRTAAERTGVDPVLLESLVQAESDFDPKTVSPKGAMGLTQLMPGTAKALGISDPLDPLQNLIGGGKYLAQMLKQFGGDERLALAGYNAGPGAVRRFGGVPPFKETQHYVDRVMARAASLRGKP